MFNIYSSNPVMLAKRFHSVAFLYALIFSDATLSTELEFMRENASLPHVGGIFVPILNSVKLLQS